MRGLKALGVKVAIDDFGTGFSSLSYLRELDVDVLKVDKSFVFALGADPASSAIVRTILTLAELLDLEVIIEGIEDQAQLVHLEELGATLVQGYLFGRPVPADQLPGIISKGAAPVRASSNEGALGEEPVPPEDLNRRADDVPSGTPESPRRWVS